VKVCSYRDTDGTARVGVIEDGRVREAGTTPWAPAPGADAGALDELALLAPVPAPGKVIGIGRNYAEHAAETGSDVPTQPQLFGMWANATVGPGADVVYPALTTMLDYEAELVAVIGRTTSRVPVADALDHVFGYTCGNDVSARDLQFGETQWIRGKTLDTFAPMGPWIVTTDEIPDPQALGIRCTVNGTVRQDDTTAHMVFGVAELVAFVSEAITLDPGDVVYTGTPPGVAFGMAEPAYLRPGDEMVVEIDGIGALRNRVVRA
jgi:2-keto-4-pentenoate hydratase/2-oxohepta-3-ene-1,7-dioic acid hydratase in catechol pathway